MDSSWITPLPARRVRRLRIRAAAEDDARRTAVLLGDALHTASLPFADQGRLIVIRRLPLGRISPRASAASLALHIERIAGEVISQAVPYDSPAAGKAAAVVFPDRSEAIIQLARVLARDTGCNEWFWPEVVRGWRSDVSREERWLRLLEAAHSAPEAALVAAAVVGEALGAGVQDRLLSSIPAGQVLDWLQLEGWTRLEPELWTPPEQRPALRRMDVIRRWQSKWGSIDDRLVWFATLLEIQKHPHRAADPLLPSRIASALLHATALTPSLQPDYNRQPDSATNQKNAIDREPGAETVSVPVKLEQTSSGQDPRDERLHVGPFGYPDRASSDPPLQLVSSDSPIDGAPVEDTQSFSSPRDASRTELQAGLEAGEAKTGIHFQGKMDSRAEDAVPDRSSERSFEAFTSYAGLLFLVPVLQRLDFPEFLSAHPNLLETGFPAGLLWFIGQRAGLKPHDPMTLALQAELIPAGIDGFHILQLPARAQEILSTPKPRCPLDSPLMAWLTSVRRWCRRLARLGLVTLIRRPGRVIVSQTHIDVGFELAQVDIRLRRLGLDLDPGWIPWLGHVVRFHYLEPTT